MAQKKRIGQTLENCLSVGMNENRDAGEANTHYLSVAIKTRRSIKEMHYQFQEPFSRRALRDFEQSTRSAELRLK
jgi:hypothetical protein